MACPCASAAALVALIALAANPAVGLTLTGCHRPSPPPIRHRYFQIVAAARGGMGRDGTGWEGMAWDGTEQDGAGPNGSGEILSHRVASHRIASHRIAPYRIVSYRILPCCVRLGQIGSSRARRNVMARCNAMGHTTCTHAINRMQHQPCTHTNTHTSMHLLAPHGILLVPRGQSQVRQEGERVRGQEGKRASGREGKRVRKGERG
jgi:hypothetical protein